MYRDPLEKSYNLVHVTSAFQEIQKKHKLKKQDFYTEPSKNKFEYIQQPAPEDLISFSNPLQIPAEIHESYIDAEY